MQGKLAVRNESLKLELSRIGESSISSCSLRPYKGSEALLFLSETLVDNIIIAELSCSFSFANYMVVDRVGRSDRLAIIWKRNMLVSVCDSSQNHVNMHISEGTNFSWRLTCVYGFLERERRRDSWEFIKILAGQSQ